MNTPDLQPLLVQRERLLGYIRKRVAEPEVAEDILQDSLLKSLRSAPEFDADERLVAWFFRVLNNAIIDYYRHRATIAKHHDYRIIDAEAAAAPTAADEAALCECFRGLLPSLKPEYAELIEKLELAEQEPASVADELGIQQNNLKVRRHRARQALRQKLEETCRTCAKHGCLDCTCSPK
ncbi:MAG: sigma-70 family RNA polymerase sigma factor [candidate division Zixibacteria bacterium]|nr:sigma-70 family RNA polymerase sigma factor [candidate division Zixibacteria bacterium]